MAARVPFKKLTKDQWIRVMVKTRSNTESILDSIRKTIGTVENPVHLDSNIYAKYIQYSAFTHAVEEYGKLLYLSKLNPDENGEYVVEYQDVGSSKGLFRWHKYKFQLAAESLGKILEVNENESVKTDLKQDPITYWDSLVNILNTDIDENGEPTDIYSNIDLDKFRKSVEDFHDIVFGFKVLN